MLRTSSCSSHCLLCSNNQHPYVLMLRQYCYWRMLLLVCNSGQKTALGSSRTKTHMRQHRNTVNTNSLSAPSMMGSSYTAHVQGKQPDHMQHAVLVLSSACLLRKFHIKSHLLLLALLCNTLLSLTRQCCCNV